MNRRDFFKASLVGTTAIAFPSLANETVPYNDLVDDKNATFNTVGVNVSDTIELLGSNFYANVGDIIEVSRLTSGYHGKYKITKIENDKITMKRYIL